MTHPLSLLRDKTAIITGAARGLGAEIAAEFLRQGASMLLVDQQEAELQATATALNNSGGRVEILAGDVTQPDFAPRAVALAQAKFGPLHILVNNAGITRDATLAKMSREQWDQVIAVNLTGVFLMGQAAVRPMIEQKTGSILNISSVARRGNFGQTNYAASKAGVDAMAKTWAVELARYGIRANAIAPGFIATAMTEKVPPEVRDKLLSRIPLRRMGAPTDIARAAAFLVSDWAGYITGQCLTVDGGLTSGLSV